MENQRAIKRNITIYPQDLVALRIVAKDMGLSSVSGAIRFVLRDWQRQQRQQRRLRILEAYRQGHITDAEKDEALLSLGKELAPSLSPFP